MNGKKSLPRHGASPVQNRARRAGLCLFFFIPAMAAFSEPLYSPAWGFRIDLPEGYEYTGGDGSSRFSFRHQDGAVFDLAVYNRVNQTVKALVDDTVRRLGSQGDVSYFEYRDKLAALLELDCADPETGGPAENRGGRLEGWALCVELGRDESKGAASSGGSPPLLLALAYGPAGRADLAALHLSALDSIAPSEGERRFPGPVTEFSYPRGEAKKQRLAGLNIEALTREDDAEAAQALVDREYRIFRRSLFSPRLEEACVRFYRAIYRDSWERLADAAFQLERYWNAGPGGEGDGVPAAGPGGENRVLAGKALAWVQSFRYERDLMGSDFVNLVSAAFEGRGDCDSRALLWAVVLAQADIPAAIMVSWEYRHAMGLGDLEGPGARFEAGEKKWLVAETTSPVAVGLIAQDFSTIESWLGVIFE
ncbi:MAG: hypothetical protein LBK27_04775 [Treponema sp.]|jgi:hypothetical protein|nr:hypothetical protein [Treponema sp.]